MLLDGRGRRDAQRRRVGVERVDEVWQRGKDHGGAAGHRNLRQALRRFGSGRRIARLQHGDPVAQRAGVPERIVGQSRRAAPEDQTCQPRCCPRVPAAHRSPFTTLRSWGEYRRRVFGLSRKSGRSSQQTATGHSQGTPRLSGSPASRTNSCEPVACTSAVTATVIKAGSLASRRRFGGPRRARKALVPAHGAWRQHAHRGEHHRDGRGPAGRRRSADGAVTAHEHRTHVRVQVGRRPDEGTRRDGRDRRMTGRRQRQHPVERRDELVRRASKLQRVRRRQRHTGRFAFDDGDEFAA